MTQPSALEGKVDTARGDVDRTCPSCAGNDGDPRHVVIGARTENQVATLANGQQVPVAVPVDVAYHLDCHAAMGCHHCGETLEGNGGSVKGKAGSVQAPAHLVELEPGEFSLGTDGVLTRTQPRQQAAVEASATATEA